jgi:hypothetical protein
MERRDWASGSRDCRRAQITQICAYTGGTVTRQSAAPNGGSVSGYQAIFVLSTALASPATTVNQPYIYTSPRLR